MPMQCELQLDNPRGIYYGGDVVSGHIVLHLPERELLKALGLEVSGYAATAWIKPAKSTNKKKTQADGTQLQNQGMVYENRTDYLSTINYFIGSEAATVKPLDGGVYQYNFSVRLPAHCPSSYEGQYGQIRYTLQVFTAANAGRQLVYSRMLTVVRLRDLREQANVLDGARDTKSWEQSAAMKFWQKPLQVEIHIPREGYTPGEGICVHVRVHNPQHLKLTELIYNINLLVTHNGVHKQKRRDTKLERCNLLTSTHKLSSRQAEATASLLQDLQTLQVPDTPPTLTAAECQCLQLNYELEVLVRTTQTNRWAQAQLPITIGSISLASAAAAAAGPQLMLQREHVQASVATLNVTDARSLDDLTAVATAPALTPTTERHLYPDLSASMSSLATNFREADFMTAIDLNKREKHTMAGKQVDFRPQYLYYEMDHEEGERVF